MTDPANNDAALVREWTARMRKQQDWPDADLDLLDTLDRLAAAAERADRPRPTLWGANREIERLETALLVAQQERDALRNDLATSRREYQEADELVERAEATNTQLREALEVVTGTLVQARFSDISDEEYDAAIASCSAALAPAAEQENA